MSLRPANQKPGSAVGRLFQAGCLAYGLAVAYDSARKRRLAALEAAGHADLAAFEPLAPPAIAEPEPVVVMPREPQTAAEPAEQTAVAVAVAVEPDQEPEPEPEPAPEPEPEPEAWPQPYLALVPQPADEPTPTPDVVSAEPAVAFEPIDESRAGLPDGLRDSLWARLAIGAIQLVCVVYSVVLLYIVWMAKDITVASITRDPVFGGYSLLVTLYVLARFSIAPFYRSTPDIGYRPSCSIVIPAFNEEGCIEATIDACFSADYPAGSDRGRRRRRRVERQDVGAHARRARAPPIAPLRPVLPEPRQAGGDGRGHPPVERRGVRVHRLGLRDRGRRALDDHGRLPRRAGRRGRRHGRRHEQGAEPDDQDAAGALLRARFGSSRARSRCSAPSRARRAASRRTGARRCSTSCDRWETQRFLGRPATYGDDRALTNYILRNHRVTYQSQARSHTLAPDTLKAFLIQQIRWRKSWLRESLHVVRFMWRKHPVAAALTYLGVLFPWVAPIVAFRSLYWHSIMTGSPWFYLMGAYVMALLYSLYYAVSRKSPLWHHGITFIVIYMAFLVWLTYYALLTLRNTNWGTRASTHTLGEVSVTVVGPGQPNAISEAA